MRLAHLGDDRCSHAQIASVVSRKIQQLIILPTEKCNFRCAYCYEDFLIGKMKEPVQQAIERFLDPRIPELAELSIDWFGGEPLMARNAVLRIAACASRLCKAHGVSSRGGMATNAYILSRELFDELLSYDQRQRLLIARPVLGRPRLIIVDEATSILEVEVEARILEALSSAGATTILMAHRPEVWALADRIYTLDAGGGVTEAGDPEAPNPMKGWRTQEDSNLWPLPSEGSALSS